ncbi:MAG: hypothetical protein ABI968_13250 [Acidobacteriota bacterium]
MHARPISRNTIAVAITIAASATVLAFQLLVPPIVGLADNGDFSRLALPTGLAHTSENAEERWFGWMQPRFRLVARTPDPGGYRSSEVLLVELAVRASRALGSTTAFDIRVLAALHILLLLAALGGLVSACRDLSAAAQVLAAALLVFFFTDVGFVAPFNSLYSQTASFLFLMLTVAVAAHGLRRGRLAGPLLPAYFLCAALWITSKPQEVIDAPLLAVFGLSMAWRGSGRHSRAVAVVLSVALCALAWRYYRSADRSIGWVTRYDMLFREILPNSPDPGRDLAELGLDPSLARFAGVNAWVPESPSRNPSVLAFVKRSGPTVQLFLLRHPKRLLSLLARTARVSYALRPHELGNFAKETGAARFQKARGIWSGLRIHLSGFPWLLVLLGGTLAAAGATYRRASTRGRRVREGLSLLVVIAVNTFLGSTIGDSQEIRHLYTFHALCDLILVADVTWMTEILVRRIATRRAEAAAPIPAV